MFIDEKKKEINCKIVYWGYPCAGKSTNIYYLYDNTEGKYRGELKKITNDNEIMILADILIKDLTQIKGYNIRFHLYAVPGEFMSYNFLKKILVGVDGIIFVAYSSVEICDTCKENHNVKSLKLLEETLLEQNLLLSDIPLVLQINRIDWPNSDPTDLIRSQLNLLDKPYFTGIAYKGIGVWESFYKIADLMAYKFTETDLTKLRKV